MNILIIDDDPSIKQLLGHFLKPAHELTELASGNEAIELLAREANKFDLVICDYELPDGNGLKVLEYLKAQNMNLDFIFFTSHSNISASIFYDRFLGTYPKLRLQELLDDIAKISSNSRIVNR